MTATRVITGPIANGSGLPRGAYAIRFVMPSTYTSDAVLPPDTILAVTDETGEILTTVGEEAGPVELIVGIAYEVQYASAEVVTGTTTAVPRNTRQTIVVPEGEGPIALATLLALSNAPLPAPTASTIIAEWLVEHEAELEALVAPTIAIGDVEGGDTADAEITGTDGDYTLNLTLPTGPEGPQGETGPPNSLSIGTVGTGTAAASITGTAPAQTLNLTLPPGNLPAGGTYRQMLVKASGDDFDLMWIDPAGVVMPLVAAPLTGTYAALDSSGAITATIVGAVRFEAV